MISTHFRYGKKLHIGRIPRRGNSVVSPSYGKISHFNGKFQKIRKWESVNVTRRDTFLNMLPVDVSRNRRNKLPYWTQKQEVARNRADVHTKNVDPKLSIDWRKETIHKMNEPPGDIESDCYWKQDHTAELNKKDERSGTNLLSI